MKNLNIFSLVLLSLLSGCDTGEPVDSSIGYNNNHNNPAGPCAGTPETWDGAGSPQGHGCNTAGNGIQVNVSCGLETYYCEIMENGACEYLYAGVEALEC